MLQRVREFQLTPIARVGLQPYELTMWEVQGSQIVYPTLEDKLYMLDWFVAPVKTPGRNIRDRANYMFVETHLSATTPTPLHILPDASDDVRTWRSVHFESTQWAPCQFILVKPDTQAHAFATHIENRLSLHPVLDRDIYESELKCTALQFLDALDYDVLCLLHERIGLKRPAVSTWESNNWNASEKIVDYVKGMFI